MAGSINGTTGLAGAIIHINGPAHQATSDDIQACSTQNRSRTNPELVAAVNAVPAESATCVAAELGRDINHAQPLVGNVPAGGIMASVGNLLQTCYMATLTTGIRGLEYVYNGTTAATSRIAGLTGEGGLCNFRTTTQTSSSTTSSRTPSASPTAEPTVLPTAFPTPLPSTSALTTPNSSFTTITSTRTVDGRTTTTITGTPSQSPSGSGDDVDGGSGSETSTPAPTDTPTFSVVESTTTSSTTADGGNTTTTTAQVVVTESPVSSTTLSPTSEPTRIPTFITATETVTPGTTTDTTTGTTTATSTVTRTATVGNTTATLTTSSTGEQVLNITTPSPTDSSNIAVDNSTSPPTVVVNSEAAVSDLIMGASIAASVLVLCLACLGIKVCLKNNGKTEPARARNAVVTKNQAFDDIEAAGDQVCRTYPSTIYNIEEDDDYLNPFMLLSPENQVATSLTRTTPELMARYLEEGLELADTAIARVGAATGDNAAPGDDFGVYMI